VPERLLCNQCCNIINDDILCSAILFRSYEYILQSHYTSSIKMSSCKVCLAAFKKTNIKVMCEDCNGEFHGKCVKMTQADYLSEQGSTWRCDPCNSTRRKIMRIEYIQGEGGVTLDLEAVMSALREIQDTQKRSEADFNKSYEALTRMRHFTPT
jgi:hypothetical protein